MPSRKKAQGKARKAAKAEKAEEEGKKQSAVGANNEQQALGAQIQRLQLQDLFSEHDDDTTGDDCLHGHTLLPEDDVAHQFMKSFMGHYYDAVNADGRKLGPDKFHAAIKATDEDLGIQTTENEVRMDWVLSFLYGLGAQFILDDSESRARMHAEIACFFELLKCATFGTEQPEFFETQIADIHTLVSFYRKKIPCSCLDEKYEEVKSVSKVGLCRNLNCSLPGHLVKRSKMLYCTACGTTNYCSRDCQVEDWKRHKKTCNMKKHLAKHGVHPIKK